MNMELISIVVAVYNAENTLKRCIDSLLSQTYQKTEIILVNDCSTDSSYDICKKYQEEYNNVVVISNSVNRGVSFTRNKGIQASNGRYICFIDSDDYVETKYLEVLYGYYVKHNTVPICGFKYHNEVNPSLSCVYQWSDGSGLVSLGEAFRLNDQLYLAALWNKLFDNDIVKGKNIRFQENLSMGEDLRFSLEFFQKTGIEYVYVVSEPLYNYVKSAGDSLMKKFALNGIDSGIANLGLIKDLAGKFNSAVDLEYQRKVENLKKIFVYSIVKAEELSNKEKLKKIREFKPEYRRIDLWREKIFILKEKIYRMVHR